MPDETLTPAEHQHHHHLHAPERKPANNYHVWLSFALTALVILGGFAATWGRADQWRSTMDGRFTQSEAELKAAQIAILQNTATIRVIEAQYASIGKQLDRVEVKLDKIGDTHANEGNRR